MPYSSGGGRASLAIYGRGVGLSGAAGTQTFAAYPWEGYVEAHHANFEGRDKVAEKIVDKGFEQLAPLIVASGNFLGLTVEQISATLVPGAQKLGRNERAYLARIFPQQKAAGVLGGLGALGSTSTDFRDKILEEMKKAAIDETVRQAMQAAVKAMGSSVPVAGLAVTAVNLINDRKSAFKSRETSIMTAASLAAAVASCWVPVIGWVVAVAIVLYSVVSGVANYWKARKAAKEAKEQAELAKKWQKFVKSVADIAVSEAKLLIDEMSVRGIDLKGVNAGAAQGKVVAHYAAQLRNYRAKAANGPEWMEDNKAKLKPQYDKKRAEYAAVRDKLGNDMLKKAVVKWELNQAKLPFVKRRPAVVGGKVIPEVLNPVKKEMGAKAGSGAPPSYEGVLAIKWKEANTILPHSDKVKFLLQAARDMRILRFLLKMTAEIMPAEQAAALAAKAQVSTPTITQAVTAQAAAAIRDIDPAAAAELEKMTPAQVSRLVSEGGVAETGAPVVQSPAAKVVVTVAAVGAAAGLALLVWKLVAASRAVR